MNDKASQEDQALRNRARDWWMRHGMEMRPDELCATFAAQELRKAMNERLEAALQENKRLQEINKRIRAMVDPERIRNGET